MLSAARPPTAIFCTADVGALGLLDAAVDLGVSVPEELSVMGFDDLAITSWSTIALSTIKSPFQAMARTACEYLVERINGRTTAAPRCTVFEVELVVRRTTAAHSVRKARATTA
jgi:LacI family transcriptional regulator